MAKYGMYSECGKIPDGSGREACDPAIVAKYYDTMPGPRKEQSPEVMALAESTWPLGTEIEQGGQIITPEGVPSPIIWVSARLIRPEYVVPYGSNGLKIARWFVDLGEKGVSEATFPLNINEGVFLFASAGHGGIVPPYIYPGADLDITNFGSGNGYFDLKLLEKHRGKYVLLGLMPNTKGTVDEFLSGQSAQVAFLGSFSYTY